MLIGRRRPWGLVTSRLPMELQKMIIDWIPTTRHILARIKCLAACARVCRAWREWTRPLLGCGYTCRNATLHRGTSMRAQPLPYRYTSVSTGSYEPPLFNFFLDVQSLKRFGTLVITNLNLDKENPMLHNIIRKCTIRELRLDNCETDSAVLLARFITSFPTLRILRIDGWSLPPSGMRTRRIPHKGSQSRLLSLDLVLVPNISALLTYFINAHPFVSALANLTLRWKAVENIEQHHSICLGVKNLFHHCSESLASLQLQVDDCGTGPFPSQVLETSTYMSTLPLELSYIINQFPSFNISACQPVECDVWTWE